MDPSLTFILTCIYHTHGTFASQATGSASFSDVGNIHNIHILPLSSLQCIYHYNNTSCLSTKSLCVRIACLVFPHHHMPLHGISPFLILSSLLKYLSNEVLFVPVPTCVWLTLMLTIPFNKFHSIRLEFV